MDVFISWHMPPKGYFVFRHLGMECVPRVGDSMLLWHYETTVEQVRWYVSSPVLALVELTPTPFDQEMFDYFVRPRSQRDKREEPPVWHPTPR